MRTRRTGPLALSAVLASSMAYAQTPYQVADINPDVVSAAAVDPLLLTPTASALYFVGYNGADGQEVLRMDAAGAITLPLDLDPGNTCCKQPPKSLTAAGDLLYFVWEDAVYRTDGTNAGTYVVKPPFGAGYTPVEELYGVGTGVFFRVHHGDDDELWYSDGTVAGTTLLTVLDQVEDLAGAAGRLYFIGWDGSGREPWVSDGTVAGTHRLKDICPGSCSGASLTAEFTGVAGTVYFVASDGAGSGPLWTTDGTEMGTQVVPGTQGGPRDLTAMGSILLYTAGSWNELWRTDGTAAGSMRLWTGFRIGTVDGSSGQGFFAGERTDTGKELWTTDGTVAGTRLVVDACPGACDSLDLETVFGSLPGIQLWQKSSELWRSDGTVPGTFRLQTFALAHRPLARFGDHVYLNAFNGASELWRTDGTVAGTAVVPGQTGAGSGASQLTRAGERLYFFAYRPDVGLDAWTTLGTAPSTQPVELAPGVDEVLVHRFVPFGDDAFAMPTGTSPKRIWRLHGAEGFSELLTTQAVTFELETANGRAFFAAGPDFARSEPWSTDGTASGTAPLADLVPGPDGSEPVNFVSHRDRMYFQNRDTGFVWRSDGTSEGTRLAISRRCTPLASNVLSIFLMCDESATGSELWISDGTTDGSRLVRDLTPGGAATYPYSPRIVDGLLIFAAQTTSDVGLELWRSDGTEAGTFLLKDIAPGPLDSNAEPMAFLDGVLYFLATEPATGRELWRTDGTTAGTVLVRDMLPGPLQGTFAATAAAGRLVVEAYHPTTGIELWTSDGTAGGWTPLPEISPGPPSAFAGVAWGNTLQTIGRRVYASAEDGTTGAELWAVDLTQAAVAIDDAVVTEPGAGTTDVSVVVRLDAPAAAPVLVGYATVAGTATAGSDFQPSSGVLTFVPGATELAVAVPIVGDLADEPDESFVMVLSPVGGTVFADRRATVAIVDDDAPVVSLAAPSLVEGDAGNTTASFQLSITTADGAPTAEAKSIAFATESGTATSGLDFFPASGAVTFPAGSPSGGGQPVAVLVRGDTTDEADESFALDLTSLGDARLGSTSVATIVDDDGVTAGRPVELVHGSRIVATLEPAAGRDSDLDFYVLRQQPFASYEVVVDETSGDASPLVIERLAADGVTVLQAAGPGGTGASTGLRWLNATSAAIDDQQVRVRSTACGTTCGADDRYRLRLYETTLQVPRFNNVGGQGTVVLVQNTTDATVAARLHFWTPSGTLGLAHPFTVPARGTAAINTLVLYASSGSLTVIHDGPYGALAGKAVALEPATGFSFDTPLTPRPR